ncbi:hypothetical protein ERJ75_000940200 [Trypanosoma vivax]|uniref:Uncharacterized protein n=1 Tax=Trypanosoma vivax (strain Y486) TaxID=1055687 RepID=G0U4E6_TRYVY|nr:hypothetical protein TRVL_02942 [Trypanosoma vivax]KAH8611514.1 hypothetical protein ERJ75_000940200 [Trypanosoma vivax]CCC52310.1 conserved hypothetical protein, fragment [Trypanosoma vivax Y486]
MPPLTLEQVLARSMRLPRRGRQNSSPLAAGTLLSDASPLAAPGSADHSSSALSKFHSLLEKKEETLASGRLSIHQSNNLIKNSQDLLAYLQTSRQMRAWEDALHHFCTVTKSLVVKQLDNGNPCLSLSQQTGGGTMGVSSGNHGYVTASVAHVTVLMNTLASARKWDLVEQLGEIYRRHGPDVLLDTVTLLANTTEADVTTGVYGWRRAIRFLKTRIPLEEQSVEVYNACLTTCERTLDWEGAFSVVRSMGPNPIKQLKVNVSRFPTTSSDVLVKAASAEEYPSTEEGNLLSPATEEHEDDVVLAPQPPSPNVVTYATLISILDQCGKESLACEVLQCLPALEKEEITAAYAALIHVWSEQKYRRYNRRF